MSETLDTLAYAPWEEGQRPAIAIDGEAFAAIAAEMRDPRLAYVAIAIAGRFCPGAIGAFSPDWGRMSAAVAAGFPDRLASPARLRRHRADLLRFFIVLPDGRWAPNAQVFATPGAACGYNA